MAAEPNGIRNDIETTRAELTRDVDRLADRTSPTRVARRNWNAVKDKVRGATDTVMGTARDGAGSVADTAESVADTVKETPDVVMRQARGNPVAAGLIAFGAGLLVATVIPQTRAERRAVHEVKEGAGELIDQVREPMAESAQEVKETVVQSAREAAADVKDTAMDAGRTTAEEARRTASGNGPLASERPQLRRTDG